MYISLALMYPRFIFACRPVLLSIGRSVGTLSRNCWSFSVNSHAFSSFFPSHESRGGRSEGRALDEIFITEACMSLAFRMSALRQAEASPCCRGG